MTVVGLTRGVSFNGQMKFVEIYNVDLDNYSKQKLNGKFNWNFWKNYKFK